MKLAARVLMVGTTLCLLAGTLAADEVIFTSGRRVTGEVTVGSETVRVRNNDGELTVAASRVARVVRAEKPDREAGARVLRSDAQPPKKASGALKVLDQSVSLDFDEVPLTHVIDYLQQITPADFAYNVADLQAETRPVSLHLEDVPLRNALDLLVDGRNLAWKVESDVIRVGPGVGAGEESLRVYEIRHQLTNTEDKRPRRSATLSESSSSEDEGEDASYAQGGWGGDEDWEFEDEDEGRAGGAAESQNLTERAHDFATLITSCTGRGKWAKPAVIRAGGEAQQEENDPWEQQQPW